jgi:N4-gp56 family major capsid protein
MAFTTTSSLALAQAAYDKLARFALRPELYFDNVADIKPTNQSMPGSSVTFPIISDLAIASSALNESTDVTPSAVSESNVTVTLAEYGNSVLTTAALRGESYVEIDPIVANVVGYNAGVSIDEVARNVLAAGTNVAYTNGKTSRVGVANTDNLKAADIRAAKARLRSQNVPTFDGFYTAYIHPNVAYDFTSETGSAAWRDPHTYSQPGEIWAGEMGAFEGFRFIETPRAPVFQGAGSSTGTVGANVYGVLCLGRQSLAKAYSMVDGNTETPHVVPGPITDYLRRFVPWGWYWLGGYSIYRQASLYRIETGSSLSYSDPVIDQ